MAMPPAVRAEALRHVEVFCENRVPDDARDQLRLEASARGNSITIVERRAPWSELVGPEWTSMKIAQLRYDERSRSWTLYACDRDERWFPYDADPAPDVGPPLAEIGDDPTGIFWG